MKLYLKRVLIAGSLCAVLAGCGGSDRSAQAKQTVTNYWNDVAHFKLNQAYSILSPGVQGTLSVTQFRQNFVGLLTKSSGVGAKIGQPQVIGDCALVPVGLMAAQAPNGIFHVFQHLYWINGGWRITEPSGGVSQTGGKLSSCPTGT